MLGSIGVIVAALLMMWKGWVLADPIIGACIGLFIVPRTFGLLKQVTHIFMEGTPEDVDLEALEARLKDLQGVVAVHDIHVWTITSGFNAMIGHLAVDEFSRGKEVLQQARSILKNEFTIDHVTIQIEDEAIRRAEPILHV